MSKIRAAIVGYGNIGHFVLDALEAAQDFEIAGVVRRSVPENIPLELTPYKVTDNIKELGKVDVAILAVPSRKAEEYAAQMLENGINTVDSFDIHTQIVDTRSRLDAIAKKAGKELFHIRLLSASSPSFLLNNVVMPIISSIMRARAAP